MYYTIYQLKDNMEATKKLFLGYDATQKLGGVNVLEYDAICTGEIPDGEPEEILEELYIEFNMHRPADFKGHSLSVSDLVALEDNGT